MNADARPGGKGGREDSRRRDRGRRSREVRADRWEARRGTRAREIAGMRDEMSTADRTSEDKHGRCRVALAVSSTADFSARVENNAANLVPHISRARSPSRPDPNVLRARTSDFAATGRAFPRVTPARARPRASRRDRTSPPRSLPPSRPPAARDTRRDPRLRRQTRQALDRRPGDPRREARRRRRYVTATRRPTRRATRSTRPFRSKKKTDDEKHRARSPTATFLARDPRALPPRRARRPRRALARDRDPRTRARRGRGQRARAANEPLIRGAQVSRRRLQLATRRCVPRAAEPSKFVPADEQRTGRAHERRRRRAPTRRRRRTFDAGAPAIRPKWTRRRRRPRPSPKEKDVRQRGDRRGAVRRPTPSDGEWRDRKRRAGRAEKSPSNTPPSLLTSTNAAPRARSGTPGGARVRAGDGRSGRCRPCSSSRGASVVRAKRLERRHPGSKKATLSRSLARFLSRRASGSFVVRAPFPRGVK